MVGGQGTAHPVGASELTIGLAAPLPAKLRDCRAALLTNVSGAALAILCLGAALTLAQPSNASGGSPAADARRLAADIVVMAGDARRLQQAELPTIHRQGLIERIAGTLATLALSVRRARETTPQLPSLAPGMITQMRRALADATPGAIGGLVATLAALTARYPLSTTGLLPPDTRPAAIARAKQLHADYCAGCHDEPDLDVARPAWNLSALALALPPEEFAARLLIGVRGETLMALENPLTDAEMSALIGYYRSEKE